MIPDDLDDGGSKEPLNSNLNKDSLIPLWHQNLSDPDLYHCKRTCPKCYY